MTAIARRLDLAWYLLSLDITRGYLTGMWFPFSSETFLDGIRSQLLPEDLPTYGSDADIRVYRRLHWMSKQFGPDAIRVLLGWIERVLVVEPSDRVAEAWWYNALFQVARLEHNGSISEQTLSSSQRAAEDLRNLGVGGPRYGNNFSLQLTESDSTILARQAMEPELELQAVHAVYYKHR